MRSDWRASLPILWLGSANGLRPHASSRRWIDAITAAATGKTESLLRTGNVALELVDNSLSIRDHRFHDIADRDQAGQFAVIEHR